MSYKFINPGYYTLFSGWSFHYGAGDREQITNDFTSNPLNGIGFKNKIVYYTVPAASSVVFATVGVYVPNVSYDYPSNISLDQTMTISHSCKAGISTVTIGEKNYKFFNKLEVIRYNRILTKIDIVAGSIDIWVNGEQLYSQTGDITIQGIETLSGKSIGFSSDSYILSNFIISDEEIKPNEDVLVLPPGAVEASVSPNIDGSYTFTEEGQQFLMATDVTPVKANDKITGVAAIGYPGYSKGDNLYHVQGMDKDKSGSITEHGLDTAPSDELAAVGVSFSVNWTKDQLSQHRIGLKTAI